jgi:hypothetical protein
MQRKQYGAFLQGMSGIVQYAYLDNALAFNLVFLRADGHAHKEAADQRSEGQKMP